MPMPNTTYPFLSMTPQQLLKAVAFFVGSVIVARNFGDAFAI